MTTHPISAETLLPCPFCGGEAFYELTVVNNSVKCSNCSASIYGVNSKECAPLAEDFSVKFWNTRATPAVSADKVTQQPDEFSALRALEKYLEQATRYEVWNGTLTGSTTDYYCPSDIDAEKLLEVMRPYLRSTERESSNEAAKTVAGDAGFDAEFDKWYEWKFNGKNDHEHGLKEWMRVAFRGALYLRTEPPQWQPIETAPRDGTYILVKQSGVSEPSVTVCSFDSEWSDSGWWMCCDGKNPEIPLRGKEPDLWAPIPTAPADKQGEA